MLQKLTLLFVLLSFLMNCTSKQQTEVSTYEVKRADFKSTISETGDLESVEAISVYAPHIPWDLGSLKITKLIDDGSEVKEGDILVEFDKGDVQKKMEDTKSELEIAEAELRKAKANHKAQINELQAELEKAKRHLEIARLNYSLAGYQPEIEKKKIELNLQNTEISLNEAAKKIENQKIINQQEINKLQLKIDQARNKLTESQSTLDLLVLKAPSEGIAIVGQNWATDNKFQVDDQPWRGMPMINLPDLSRMQATVMINEVDISKIDTTQSASVTLDAYPDTIFSARVKSIAALAREKKRNTNIKIFDVVLEIEGEHEKLIPGMTVRCEILTNQIADTIFIPLEGVFKSKEGPFVYLKDNGSFKKQTIKTGIENDNYVIVTDGLKEGDQISLVDPMQDLNFTKQDQKEQAEESND